jgi:hypothetical protein
MQLQLRSLDKASRRELTQKVSLYKSSLKSLEDDYERARQAEERNDLFGDGGGDGISVNRIGVLDTRLSLLICQCRWSAENSVGVCRMLLQGLLGLFF